MEMIDHSEDTSPSTPIVATSSRIPHTRITKTFATSKAGNVTKRKRDEAEDGDRDAEPANPVTKKNQRAGLHAQIELVLVGKAATASTGALGDTLTTENSLETTIVSETGPMPNFTDISSSMPSITQSTGSSDRNTVPVAVTSTAQRNQAMYTSAKDRAIHPRFVPVYLDSIPLIAIKDPKRFCTKPPL